MVIGVSDTVRGTVGYGGEYRAAIGIGATTAHRHKTPIIKVCASAGSI
jgi:hypothetical protein